VIPEQAEAADGGEAIWEKRNSGRSKANILHAPLTIIRGRDLRPNQG
jgi:hypothetical protein